MEGLQQAPNVSGIVINLLVLNTLLYLQQALRLGPPGGRQHCLNSLEQLRHSPPFLQGSLLNFLALVIQLGKNSRGYACRPALAYPQCLVQGIYA
eukprot:CAMPEP_0177628804 /NCGR_PEP_ID=MMETSP0447-20121125/327_1 /TAXON_ID=0 /ORGANISM="Stygamoeba regulata, Strain BSH-02190019" /LENGTH=94 /DNA_ID=CAMNT_0019130077 /DNA_START=436 /DNA_END=720 /DNA_ORIENTATION=+